MIVELLSRCRAAVAALWTGNRHPDRAPSSRQPIAAATTERPAMSRVAVATTRTWSRHLDYRRRRETVPPTVAIATTNPEDSIIARTASHIVPVDRS
ncbi:unnamed protein product [Heligmosomoides polygyrus]|uniref:Secreted protein n=1 Tax=Heligmosomoides polygyrus TaxID=6339 RepID=A0A183GMB0_HELPZ|nr:unnamed protein product [Heligmosomoides polygyrus]